MLLASAVWWTCLAAQTGANYLTVGPLPKVEGKRNAALEVKIPCAVAAGFHVNSNTPSDEYLIPLTLTWTSTGALEAGPVTYPKPELQKYEFSEKPLSVFTGQFDLIAHFQVAANAPAGPGVASGKLRYQACNNRACYAPKTIDLAIPYQIQ
jgi:hypothetical protein